MMPYIPPELVILIVSHIHELQHRLPFLRVCKPWNSLLRSTVFSSIDINNGKRLVEIVHAVHQDTRLARSIRTVSLGAYWMNHRIKYNGATLRDFVTEIISTEPRIEFMERDLNQGNGDAWKYLLLVKLERLEHLDLGFVELQYIGNMVYRILRPPPGHVSLKALQNLKTIELWPLRHDPWNLRAFAAVLLLPRLTVFICYYLYDSREYMSTSEDELAKYYELEYGVLVHPLPAGSSSVRELTFEMRNCGHSIRPLITACAALERFEYQHLNNRDKRSALYNFRPHEFYKSLLLHHRTLQVLRLNNMGEVESIGHNTQDEDTSWFGSLADFTALRELRMPLRNLLGYGRGRFLMNLPNVLPHTLELLCLAHVDRQDYVLLVENLSALLQADSNLLQNVIVQLYQLEMIDGKELPRIPKLAEEAFAGVRDEFGNQGVDFKLSRNLYHEVLRDGEVIADATIYVGNPASF